MYYLFSNEKGYWDGSGYVSLKVNAIRFHSYELAFDYRYIHGLDGLTITE